MEDLKKRHTETVKHLDRWSQIVTQAQWKTPHDIENQLPMARALGGGSGRHVFNIMGNKYRLIVRVDFDLSLVEIRFAGTHPEYDNISDARKA
ncbi:MAG: type II toxin-antitoxin system HigB family toxin [Gemmatimonadota bacterium]|nr:type II toxin-antitoxin system HigB family toxin [Gemmatimonadota bacterium]